MRICIEKDYYGDYERILGVSWNSCGKWASIHFYRWTFEVNW
jgi:hypothetical protein